MLHCCNWLAPSVASHGFPHAYDGTDTEKFRNWTPPPHVALHSVQLPHDPTQCGSPGQMGLSTTVHMPVE